MKMFRVVVNGSEYKVGIEELAEESTSQPVQTKAAPTPKPAQPKPTAKAQPKPAPAKADPAAAGGTVVAPMPGTVLQVTVNTGDNVTKGQTLLVLEAMKMENEIMAPADGVVQEVNVTQGVSVNAGDILIVLTP
ncbi:MAG: biotin/lipoyl-binding protein [Desulfobulbaceae bacterium]|nr:biotin/lipoyl-binding protein [Desulfobulbaceae bacterium]